MTENDANNLEIPGTGLNIDQILSGVIEGVILAVGIGAFVGIVYSGFLWITASGDASKAETAKKNLLWAIIGLVIALFSFGIVRIVGTLDFPGRPGAVSINIVSQTHAQAEAPRIEDQPAPTRLDGLRGVILPECLRTAERAREAGVACVLEAIRYYTNILLLLVGVGSFIYILYGAFLYTTAFGAEEKVNQGRKIITYAIIGILIAVLSFTIINIIYGLLRVPTGLTSYLIRYLI